MDTQRDIGDVHAQRMTMWGHGEKAAVYKPRREASEEAKPTHTLVLDF